MLEKVLVAGGAERLARAVNRQHTLVLAYHNVVPDLPPVPEASDASLHISQTEFAAQLDILSATHDVVPLPQILETARRARPTAVITFDDAYAGALAFGLGETSARGLPATVFVAPALCDTYPWWDRLAENGVVPAATRALALMTYQGRTQSIDDAFGAGVNASSRWMRIAAESEVIRAASLPGVTIASHSWSHPNLAALEAEELRQELSRSLAWLDRFGERAIRWLSYPYGCTSPMVARAAELAGYQGALRIDGGAVSPAGDRYQVSRLNVPAGMSLAGFRLRLAGVFGG